MIKFDRLPVMDREYFEQCAERAKYFAVWVQVHPGLQMCLEITKIQARQIADYGFASATTIWGRLDVDAAQLNLSMNSQWLDKIYEVKPRPPEGQACGSAKSD